MRTLSSILVGVLALVALCVFFVLHSVLSYVENPDAVTRTARGQALHERVLAMGELVLVKEMRSAGLHDEALHQFVTTEARPVLAEVFAPDWFYPAFGAAYAGALAMVHDQPPEPIDLRERKSALGAGLAGVAETIVEGPCQELIGTPSCEDEASRSRLLATVLAGMRQTLNDIPDILEVETVAARAGLSWLRRDSRQAERARQALRIAGIARYVALGAMLLFFLVIGVSNRPPVGRMLIAVGLAIGLTSAGYIAALHVADATLREPLERALVDVRTRAHIDVSTEGRVAVEAAEDLSQAIARDAIHASDNMVIGLGGVGFALVVIGVLMYRRRRAARSRPPHPAHPAQRPPHER